jgi:hypothetical protein
MLLPLRPQEFNIEKLQLVEAEKQKIRKEYERKESQVEVKKKMCVPAAPCARRHSRPCSAAGPSATRRTRLARPAAPGAPT